MKNYNTDTHKMSVTVATFSCSSARCEASFSALNRIVYRRRISFARVSNLISLAFEKKTSYEITNEILLREFDNAKKESYKFSKIESKYLRACPVNT